MVIATGVSYRREGSRVWRPSSAGASIRNRCDRGPAMAGEPVFVVGGANSAGEAAIYLARYAARVTCSFAGRPSRRACPITSSANSRRFPISTYE